MRASLPVALALCACSSSGVRLDPSVTPRPADEAPPAVLARRAEVVAVYVNATCDHLPEDAQARGTGFWVNGGTVATAGHAMDVRDKLFPDFAVLGADGCRNGRYADWFEAVDLLFITVSGPPHASAVRLEKRLVSPGETLWQYAFQGRDADGAPIFVPLRITSEALEDGSKVFFGSRPMPAPGDSGAPVLDAAGGLIGMTQAIGSYKGKPERGHLGVHLASLVIRHFLSECAGGGPCGDEEPE